MSSTNNNTDNTDNTDTKLSNDELIRLQQAEVTKTVISGNKLGGARKEFVDKISNGVDSSADVFEDINISQLDNIQTIESLCMKCYKNGTTKLLLTRIPHFRDIVIMAFECPFCYFKSSEVQSAKDIQEFGVKITLNVTESMHMNRQVIKENTATIIIKELEFEIPPAPDRGAEVNTVEGFLQNAAESLGYLQKERFEQQPEVAEKIQVVIEKLKNLQVFTFIIDDPTGNSFLQNPFAPAKDPFATIEYYKRTPEQNVSVGLSADYQESNETIKEETEEELAKEVSTAPFPNTRGIALTKEMERQLMVTYFDVSSKAVTFNSVCHACNAEAETRMCIFDIPFFKEIVMMVSDCASCGFKDSEVKPGGNMSEKGRRVKLRVDKLSDLKRDLLKSDTAGVEIPELDLEVVAGSLGGKYTTVEGLLNNIKDKLMESSFAGGDSATSAESIKFREFESKLDDVVNAR